MRALIPRLRFRQRTLRGVCGSALVLFACALPAVADTLPDPVPQRVLFVGNSLTGQNFVPALVRELATARGVRIEVDQFTRGDYSLEDHLREPRLEQKLREGWDILVLQQGPSSTPVNRLWLIQHTQEMAALAGADAGRVALFAPWPQRTALRTAGESLESYRQAAVAVGGCVLPVGSAWSQHRGGDGLSMLYAADGLHATPAGSQLAALVIARGLFGFEPGLSPPPPDENAQRLHASAAAAYVGHATECSAAQQQESVGRFDPAQGYWSVHDAPGSGLFVEQRDGLMAVAAYAHAGDPGRAQWWLGSATPAHGEVVLDMHAFAGGTCLECEPPGTAAAVASSRLHLRFESSRRAWARFDGGEPRAFSALPFGATYLDVALADHLDVSFGTLPTPSPIGEWMFAVHDGSSVSELVRVRIDAPIDGSNRFPAGEWTLDCTAARDTQRAGCALVRAGGGGAWWFAAGDIDAQRMQGSLAGSDRVVVGHRLEPAAAEAPLCGGFWSRPGHAGEGVSLQQAGSVLALTVYDTGNGLSRWSNAAAPLQGLQFAGHLMEFTGGACLGCATTDLLPSARGDLQARFLGARSAMLQVGPSAAFMVAAAAYGGRYIEGFGTSVPLPDLRGTWLLGFPGGEAAPLALRADRLERGNGTVVFHGDDALTLTCTPAVDGDGACVAAVDAPGGPLRAEFPLSAMCEEIMRGSVGTGGAVVAHRLRVGNG